MTGRLDWVHVAMRYQQIVNVATAPGALQVSFTTGP
jgi:hypothetical protein